MPRGKYIVIEGNDGTGKSTQVELLAEYLNKKGIETFVIHEPDGPGISAEIRKVIKNGELERTPETNLLLFTASRHEIWRQAREKLEQGVWVLSARNYLSTIVFQGYGEGLDIDLIKETTLRFTDAGYVTPDHTIILTLTKEERENRIAQRGELQNKDTFESRGSEFQAKLDTGYIQLAEQIEVPTVDAMQSIEAVQLELRRLLGIL